MSSIVFSVRATPQESLIQEIGEKVWRKEVFSLVKEGLARDHLDELDIHKSIGPDGMHSQLLREVVDIIARPPVIICERSWQSGEVPEYWKKTVPQSSTGQEGGPW